MSRLDNGIIIAGAAKGTTHQVLSDSVTIKLSSADTGGAFTMVETVTPIGAGTPPHIHHNEDETFYVLEGELEFWCEEGTTRGGPGSVAHLPKDIPHCFTSVGSVPARFIVVATPGGIEDFFAEMGALPLGPPDFPKIIDIAGRHGIDILPPKA